MNTTTIGSILIDEALPETMRGRGVELNAKNLKALFQEIADNDPDAYKDAAAKLTRLGGEFAFSKGDLSFSPAHMRQGAAARLLKSRINAKLRRIVTDGSLSPAEKEKAILALAQAHGDELSNTVYDEQLSRDNPLALQVASGVRGNKTALRTLLGGDVLYSDNKGRTIPIPVLRGYAQGLRPAEYWAGTYGTRAGVIAVKNATADAGFFCLHEDTPVRMADGSTKPIKEIQVGDEVLGADRDANSFPVKVLNVFDNGPRTLYWWRFTNTRGDDAGLDFMATDDHKVLCELNHVFQPFSPSRRSDAGKAAVVGLSATRRPGVALVAKRRGDVELLRLETAELRGEFPTFDIEVDHPDHLFVLANGAIVSNSKQLVQAAHRRVVTSLDAEEDDAEAGNRGLPVDADDDDSVGSLLSRETAGFPRNTVITARVLKRIRDAGVKRFLVRSPAVGGPADGGLYARDAGVRDKGGLSPIGDFVGHIAAQAIAEPLSQGQLCLAGGTLVRMADGSTKAIEDVRVGDSVLGADAQANVFPVEVLRVFDNGEKRVGRYTVGVLDRLDELGRPAVGEKIELLATGDHKVLAWRADEAVYHVEPVIDVAITDKPRFVIHRGETAIGRLLSFSFPPSTPTYDIEVDHPDHLFVLANGLIVSNSAKHSGGIAGNRGSETGFQAVERLVNPPKEFGGFAAHANRDGRVTSIIQPSQGGWDVSIDGETHHVPGGLDVSVKVGDDVEAGDVISDGLPNIRDIVQHKGIGDGRRYFVKVFRDVFRNSGMSGNRRNMEVLARGLIDHVRLDDESGSYVPGDVVSYSSLATDWSPRPGSTRVRPSRDVVGKYLETPTLHYTIGTKIRPSHLKEFAEFGIDHLDVHRDPPPFHPEMVRGVDQLKYDPDWMTRHLGTGLKKSTLDSAHRGATADASGTSFVSAMLDPVSFGLSGKTRGWDPKTTGKGGKLYDLDDPASLLKS